MIPALAQPRIPALSRLSILIYIPSFLPGVVAYVLPRVPRLRSYLWPVFILALALVFTLYPALHVGWVLGLLLGLLIPSFAELRTPWLCMLSKRIATYSYGIYVSHQFSIWIALGVLQFQPFWLRTTVLIALLLGLPVLLYHAIEKPMIDVGIRITTRGPAREVAVPAAAVESR